MGTVGPTAAVLSAFGVPVNAERSLLAGGEETSFVVGNLVLKRVQDSVVSRWCQALLADLDVTGVRIPEPVRAPDGSWEADGWICTEFVSGLSPLLHQPDVVIEAGAAFCSAVNATAIDDIGPVLERADRWARADRFVWGEEEIVLGREAAALEARLRHRMSETSEDRVVVHGDLSANVFADRSGSPIVLDFTPYVRPRRFGPAIVVADHLLWHAGRPELRHLIGGDDDGLARALLFRLVSEQLADKPRHGARLGDYWRALDLLGWR